MQISETTWQVSPSRHGVADRGSRGEASFAAAMAAADRAGAAGDVSGPRVLNRLDAAAEGYASERRAIDEGMASLATGGGSPADLLVLQQQVSDVGLKVEVATRVVDRLAGGVKQLLSIQV